MASSSCARRSCPTPRRAGGSATRRSGRRRSSAATPTPTRCSTARWARATAAIRRSTSSSPGTPQVPDATGLELLAADLRAEQPDAVLDTEFFRDQAALHVAPAAIGPTLEFLRGRGFTFLASVHGLDYYPEEPRFG